ncbi:MAG TPA: LrgB family protein [Candidatus Macondimonas sp.]|nr:LrgB family protein [Candidatus Macondimonas sp.]
MALWTWLWATPATAMPAALLLTLGSYALALQIYQLARRPALLHPAITAMLAIMAVLIAGDIDYARYFEGAAFIHFLLGPATVSLAVPLYRNLAHVRRLGSALAFALVMGATVAVVAAWLLGRMLQLSDLTLRSLLPKSVTTPIAMGLAETLGGSPSLAAGIVLVTGVIGCVAAPLAFRLLRVRDPAAQGFALGVAAHGFGTAKAFEISPLAGAFASLGLGLTGLVTALALPWIARAVGF